jgi:phosphoglycolate phosphatase-like HAD superfamily hydrolase
MQSLDVDPPQRIVLRIFSLCMSALLILVTVVLARAEDPLPSWKDSASRRAVMDFAQSVTDPQKKAFVHPEDRIAVFDNDGTLWAEQPMYVQLAFALDRVKALAPQHPQWQTTEPFKSALSGDLKNLAVGGHQALIDLVMATHAGMTTDEFARTVNDWLAAARHPRFKRPYTEVVYQPMLELLQYLRAHGFKTFIVSGGGVEFMRTFAEKVYGVPPEQVIGSTIATKFGLQDGKPVLIRLPKIDFIDDKAGKPVGINKFIGRRPIFAFGNSDGDLQMLQWTAAGEGARFMGLLHHTDPKREYAYDRESLFGRLDKSLEDARQRGWVVVDMQKDWHIVFPFER